MNAECMEEGRVYVSSYSPGLVDEINWEYRREYKFKRNDNRKG